MSVATTTPVASKQPHNWYLSNFDPVTCDAPDLEIELQRLKAVKRYDILDKDLKPYYQQACVLATRVFNCPIGMVSIVDLGRAWFTGMSPANFSREVPRQQSFCAHSILSREPVLVVPDATKDPRFSESPLVTGPSGYRFYAGAQLITKDGFKIGALCLLDTVAHPEGLSPVQKETLEGMAQMVMDMIESNLPASTPENTLETDNVEKEEMMRSTIVTPEVHTTLTFLRNDLIELSQDSELQKHMTPRNKRTLKSAFAGADYISDVLITRKYEKKQRRSHQTSEDMFVEGAPPQEAPQESQQPTPMVGRAAALDITSFIKSLQFVMDQFPKKVHLVFSVDSAVPAVIVANDLKVFRSAIALLTSACERTARGFIRLTIKIVDGQLAFECEDTSPATDYAECDQLFLPPKELPAMFTKCIRVDETTGEIKQVCKSPSNGSLSSSLDSASLPEGFGVHVVAEYMNSVGGKYGCRQRVAEPNFYDAGTGCVFWFSIPI